MRNIIMSEVIEDMDTIADTMNQITAQKRDWFEKYQDIVIKEKDNLDRIAILYSRVMQYKEQIFTQNQPIDAEFSRVWTKANNSLNESAALTQTMANFVCGVELNGTSDSPDLDGA